MCANSFIHINTHSLTCIFGLKAYGRKLCTTDDKKAHFILYRCEVWTDLEIWQERIDFTGLDGVDPSSFQHETIV